MKRAATLVQQRKSSVTSFLALALCAALAGIYVVFFSQAAVATGNIWVDTNGGSCARQATAAAYNDAAACGSIQAAWSGASAGDIIRMRPGTYGAQSITGNKTAETQVIGEDGVTVSKLNANGSFLTVENMTANYMSITQNGVHDITLRNFHVKPSGPDVGDVYWNAPNSYNISWIGGSLRNYFNSPGYPAAFAVYSSSNLGSATVRNVTIDGVIFDSITRNTATGDHFEVIRVDGNVDGFTLKNSTFTNSETNTGTLFFTTDRGIKPKNITLENNFFGPPGSAVFVINQNTNADSTRTCSNWNFRYNTFKSAMMAGGNCGVYDNVVWTGNLGPAGNCQGSSFVDNVWYGSGTPCSAGDKIIASPGFDADGFHLLGTSLARDKGGTGAGCITTDHDGDTRPNGTACDAGADEYTGTTPAPTPPPPAPPAPGPLPPPPPPPGTLLLGNQTVEGLADGLSAGQSEAWPFSASAGGTAGTVSLNLDASSTAQGVKVGLYANTSGSPGTLLAQATISSPVGGWNTASLSPQVSITSGIQYWIAVLGTGSGQVVVRDRGTSGTCLAKVNALPNDWNTAGLKNPFGPTGGDFPQCPLSAYLSSTTTPPPPPPVKPGDINGDNAVNIFDLSILLSNYGKTRAASSDPDCDINNDNVVNIFDLSILLSKYGS